MPGEENSGAGQFDFGDWSDRELYDRFVSIIGRRGKKNNTYKFAMARFLLDLCCDPSMILRMYGRVGEGAAPGAIDTADGIKVKYAEIARYYFAYYWPLACTARLRQGPNNETPDVVEAIEKEFGKRKYEQSARQIIRDEPEKVERCLKKIARVMPRQVIHRFQIVDGREIRMFYQYAAGPVRREGNRKIDLRGGILVNPSAAQFLRENYGALCRAVAFEWMQFTHSLNPGASDLAGRFFAAYDGCSEGVCDFLPGLETGGRTCFYCDARPDPGARMHVDHFLPAECVDGTREWNLVLACQECGPKKACMLPPYECIAKLRRRNAKRREDGAAAPLGKMTAVERRLDRHYEIAKRRGRPVAESLPAACP